MKRYRASIVAGEVVMVRDDDHGRFVRYDDARAAVDAGATARRIADAWLSAESRDLALAWVTAWGAEWQRQAYIRSRVEPFVVMAMQRRIGRVTEAAEACARVLEGLEDNGCKCDHDEGWRCQRCEVAAALQKWKSVERDYAKNRLTA